MINTVTPRLSVRAGAAILFLGQLINGCGRGRPAAQPSDSTDMADMPGMVPPANAPEPKAPDGSLEVSLTAEQIRHGGVRWAPADGGSNGAQAAALSLGTLPGQLAPNEDRTARLGAPGEGRVLAVRVSPGDRVRQGQVLVTLESAMASMAQSDLAKATAAVASARAQATFTVSARQRAERLLTLKAIPRQDYERAIADDDLASAVVAQAEAELSRARSTAVTVGVTGTAAGELAIRAPLSGVVLERTTTPGTVVAAGTPLVVVTNPGDLWLTMSAPEAAIGLLRIGDVLRFTVPAYPADTFAARVSVIGAGLDPETRTLPVRAVVRNPAGRLKPAMLAAVSISATGTKLKSPGQALASTRILLPADAIQLVDGRPMVFVAIPDNQRGARFTGRPVQVGGRSAAQVTVTGGIRLGELVVVQGAFAVKAAVEKRTMPKMEM